MRRIIEHADLANYREPFLHAELDDEVGFNNMVSPAILGATDSDVGWRRELCLTFYPRGRNFRNPEKAARVVVDPLSNRVAIHLRTSPQKFIAEMWENGIAAPEDWERLYVAPLRSETICARLNHSGRAEIRNGAD